MNQKGFVNIILVIVIVAVLIGAGTYFALNRQARLTPNPTPTPTPVAPASGPITVNGKTTCLTKKGSDQQTLECLIGLQSTDDRSYVLKGYSDPEYKFAEVGLDVKVSGIFTPGEVPAADGNKYDVVGTIDVSSIKKVDGSVKSDPRTSYPDNNSPGNSSPPGNSDSGSNIPPSSNCEVTVPKPTTLCPNGANWDFVPTDSNCHGSWKCVTPL